jgi:hypothetical protein
MAERSLGFPDERTFVKISRETDGGEGIATASALAVAHIIELGQIGKD